MNLKPDYKKAKKCAEEIIKDLGYVDPPVSIIEIASDYNFTVYRTSMPPQNPDVSGFIDVKNKKIYVNKNDSTQRQRFTIAHELGHYIMYKDEFDKDPKNLAILYRSEHLEDDKPTIEKEVDYFAANLLVPLPILKKFKDLPVGILSNLFDVSQKVIVYRLKELGRNEGLF